MNHGLFFWKQGQRQHAFDDDDDEEEDYDDGDDNNINNNYKVGQVHIFQSVHYGSVAKI
jgi:hypothetical protein